MQAESNTHLCDLERVIRLFWKKRANLKLAQAMEEDQTAGNSIKTLNDVKALLGKSEYEKLTKGFDF